MGIRIVFEDDHIFVVDKPAGVATETDKGLAQDLASYLRSYMRRKYNDRICYVGVVHRLDQPVRGLLVFGKTAQATSRLSKAVRENQIDKKYYALLTNSPAENQGTLTHYLRQDKQAQKAYVCEETDPEGKKCVLTYEVVSDPYVQQQLFPDATGTMVRVHLSSGRFHQIRAQFAAIGCPLVDDAKYGGEVQSPWKKGVCLCAYELGFAHPITGKGMEFSLVAPQR